MHFSQSKNARLLNYYFFLVGKHGISGLSEQDILDFLEQGTSCRVEVPIHALQVVPRSGMPHFDI
jgi:hypothetical protein